MNWKQLVLGSLASLVTAHAGAVEPWVPTDREMASLPPFCKVKMKPVQGSVEYKLWQSTLGPDFMHTHHYCAGINFINRYYRSRSQQDKSFNLNNARTNLEYMVGHADPAYSLMPDVYLNLGVVHTLMNQTGQAITHFNKAIELNPRQPRAYGALADYYAKIKQTAKALEILTAGLRYNPDTKSLQRRYTELGGKLPYPTPIEPAPDEAPVVKPDEAIAATPANPVEPAADTPTTVTPAADPIDPPKIGSPTNPYCRFCPD